MELKSTARQHTVHRKTTKISFAFFKKQRILKGLLSIMLCSWSTNHNKYNKPYKYGELI